MDGGKGALQSKSLPELLKSQVWLGGKQLAHLLTVDLNDYWLAPTTVM